MKPIILIYTVILALLAASCAPQAVTPTPEPIITEEQPVPSNAVVESVEVQVRENSPLQVNIIVRGQLPDAGCTTIASIDQTREDNTFKVTLTTTTDPLALCTFALTPFEQVVALDVNDLMPGVYLVNVNGAEESFELLPRNVSEFKQTLVDALNARDYDLLKILMDESLMIAYWRSEGTSYTPELAIEQLKLNLLDASSQVIADPEKDLVTLLGADPITIVGPDVIEVSPLFVSGIGSEGGDEAILFIAQLPDGSLYWYGILFAKDGFTQGSGSAQQ